MVLLQARRLAERLSTPFDLDTYLSTVNPLWGDRLRGVIVSIEPQTDSAASIRIRPGHRWQGHRAGQFVTLGVDVDGVRHHRCFSLTSVPGDELIEITVQATPEGLVSPHLVHHARPGDVVQLSQPEGEFTLPEFTLPEPSDAEGLLFVTGGSGITPAMGMLRTLAATDRHVGVVLVHHVESSDRLLFADELEQLAASNDWLRIELVFSQPDGRHRLTPERLDRRCPDWRTRRSYVSGPESMLEFATQHWGAEQLDHRLQLERFGVTTIDLRTTGATDREVALARFERAGLEVDADTATPLLEVAERAGLTPPNGCRMGICHTCSTRLEHGCARDLRDGRLRQAGEHVQLCVTAAADDVVLDL